eukprot:TRINITY_DN2241_c0_g1_i5.p1 TRINITY_DN2241_c0_g1~~TRINITY_DN2241_c0_g1_i5.p1  ORF type:complete len:255 (+),score=40.55 TRINITY_DN2241_c0_g1_i5:899-1663(+)
MEKLNLLANKITTISPTLFPSFPQLKVFVCKGNPILVGGNPIPIDVFRGNTRDVISYISDHVNFLPDRSLSITGTPEEPVDLTQAQAYLSRDPPSISWFNKSVISVSGNDKATKRLSLDLVDKILGCIFGNALGDAMGLATEFMTKETAAYFYELPLSFKNFIQDEHRSRWIYGDWTDDTDQMILILDSIIENNGKIDHLDFAQKLKKWVQQGFPELGDSTSSGCGQNTYRVIKHSSYEEDPIAASTAVWELSG